ncbi:unnamed protein product [Scytosiphon promiscuus]
MPSQQDIAQQLGVDLASEPELAQIVSKMRATPLPPTWTVVDTSVDSHKTVTRSKGPTNAAVDRTNTQKMEYVNRVTNVRTSRHPGTAYFLDVVASERKNAVCQGRDDAIITFGPPRSLKDDDLGGIDGSSSPNVSQHRHDEEYASVDLRWEGASCNNTPEDAAEMDGRQAAVQTDGDDGLSEVKRAYDERPDATEDDSASAWSENHGADEELHSRKRAYSKGRKGGKRMPPPQWLVFTSWWHETTSGTENIVSRKHASIRYATSNDSFEVELEDVPAIFEVSHATGRYGRVETVDIRVGAQISILGRQMRLMQCDGLTAQWLESEVRAIVKAKAALVSALEESDRVRVTCRSDRLETSASAQRGSGSVGQAAEMDRRALMNDVLLLRDALSQTRPHEALRISERLLHA